MFYRILLLLLLTVTLSFDQNYNEKKTIAYETDYVYVSNLGNDNNSGLTEDKPVKTISKALKLRKNILLRKGDVFYENITINGHNIGAYGKGKKPKLCGWKYLKNANWEKYGNNIWRLNLDTIGYTGRVKSSDPFHNDVGLIRNVDNGEIYGVKCQCLYKKDCIFKSTTAQMNTWLQHDMDFAQTSVYGKGKLKGSDFKYLYLYYSKDPNKLHLAVSTHGSGITADSATIDGISIEGFSCHGIAAGSNIKITNCDISYIGGAQQVGYQLWVRYGNGIEFYISRSKENGYVAHNNISHTFDCGTTIQGSDHLGAYPTNIVIEHNKIYNCRQAFEYFLRNNDKKTGKIYDCIGCVFRKNTCVDNGSNGFGTHETRDGQILSYQNDYVSSIKIEDNIFIGGPSLYFAIHPENIRFGKGNKFYLTEGTTLWSPYQASGRIKYYKKNISAIHKKLEDKKVDIKGVKLVRVSDKRLNRLINKFKR